MKIKISLFVMLMFVGILSTQAQPGQRRTPEERTKMTVERLTDSLKISAAQQTDVSAAYLEYYNAQDKLRAGLAPGGCGGHSTVSRVERNAHADPDDWRDSGAAAAIGIDAGHYIGDPDC